MRHEAAPRAKRATTNGAKRGRLDGQSRGRLDGQSRSHLDGQSPVAAVNGRNIVNTVPLRPEIGRAHV